MREQNSPDTKKAGIIYSPELETTISSLARDQRRAPLVANWIHNGYRRVILISDYPARNFRKIRKFTAQESSLDIHRISLHRLSSANYRYHKRVVSVLKRWSIREPVLLIYSERNKDLLEFLLELLLLPISLKSPASVVEEITGRKHFIKSDKRIFDYLGFLGMKFRLPPILDEVEKQSIEGDRKVGSPPPKIRFSIRSKLLFIITGILVISLSGMIYFATSLFEETSSVMIQEFNLGLARMAGNKLESDLRSLAYRATAFSDAYLNSNPKKGDWKKKAQRLFQENQNLIYLSRIDQTAEKKLNSENQIFNDEFLDQYSISSQKIQEVLESNLSKITLKSTEKVLIENMSLPFGQPIVLCLIPTEKSNHSLVLLLSSQGLLESFWASRQNRTFSLFLVDRNGNLIAHSNEDTALNPTAMIDVPIIQSVLESSIRNGSKRYVYDGRDFLGSFQVMDFGGLGIVSTVPTELAFASVQRIRRENFFIAIIVLSLAFLLIFFFAKTLTIPITNLVSATQKVERGDYELGIVPSHRDEVGLLTYSFLQMAHGLEEREKIKNEFGKFVAPEIAERALRGEIRLGGEGKECTVFFSDIRNFTTLSENRSPAEVVEILNEYFTEMVECVQQTDGFVDKFIGDAVMAHWGSIVEHKDDPQRAVQTALKMRKSLVELNRRIQNSGKPLIRIGCGINTGSVIAGQIGSETRLEYTVIGDAVNLASRIEYLNKHFGTDILISEATYEKLHNGFHCIRMPAVEVRGKERPQIVYAVLGEKSDPNCPRTLDELRRLVGIEFNPVEMQKSVAHSSDKIVGGKIDANPSS